LRYQNEELYQENNRLNLQLQVLQKVSDQKDIHIANLEAQLREYERAFGSIKVPVVKLTVSASDFE
jgi:hypothetical protein